MVLKIAVLGLTHWTNTNFSDHLEIPGFCKAYCFVADDAEGSIYEIRHATQVCMNLEIFRRILQ